MKSNLDSSQREAVCCGTGPCEVIAGPGSGKTLVLTEHILYLIEHEHVPPSGILVLTFSRAAAAQMKERFSVRSQGRFRDVRFGTFHSVFFYILRESTGRNYALLTAFQREKILSQLILNYYDDPKERPAAEELEKMLRASSNTGEDAEKIRCIQRDYRSYLRENRFIDFDDMILACRHILTRHAQVREYWQKQFRAILVDEFQDVNAEQYEVLRLLTDGRGLFVVGDDDQSIYGFRGSSPSIMQRFMTDFPGAVRIFLGFNYRCSANICKAAGIMIRENRIRIEKAVQAVCPPGDRVVLKGFKEDRQQLDYLADELARMTEEEQCRAAVITRTNLHVQKVAAFLSSRNITCAGKISASQAVLETVLRDLEHYRRLSMGMREGSLPRQSLYRVMNRPERYLLRSVADKEQIPVQRLRDNILRQKGSVTELTEFLKDLFVLSTIDPEGFLRYLFDAMGYGRWAQENLGSAYEVKKVQEELLRLSRQFKDTGEMIEAAVRGREKHRKESSGGVQIMTMHACKGLEFERVYLPALNEGIIPGRRCREAEDLEEERRLLYVAMTRARQHLELLYVTGSRENPRPPSRFLSVYGVKSFVYS